MKKNDGYKKIKSLFYIVAIISMIIAIVGKVRAEGLPDYALAYLDNTNLAIYIDNTTETSLTSAYADALNMPYFIHCKGNRSSSYYETYVFCDHDGIGFLRTTTSSSNYEFPAYLNNSTGICTNITSSFDVNCIVFNIYVSGNIRMNFCARRTYHFNSGSGSRNSVSWSNSYVYGSTSSAGNPSFNLPFNSSSKVCVGSFYGINSNTMGGPYFYINDLYDTVYDDNFVIYKSYGVGGSSDPLLNIQYADNIFSQGYTYTSSTTYNLVFNVDNTSINIAMSSSAYPDDFFENGSFRTSFDLIYRMLSNRILNFNNANNVVLTSVSMSATAYPTSDQEGTPETVTKSTLCNLVLKGSQGSSDIESDVIPAVSDVTIVYDQVVGSNDFHNHTGVYTPNQPVPSWAETYTIVLDTGGTTNHGAPWSTVDLYLPFEALSEVAFSGYTDPAFQLQGATYIDYNNLNAFLLNPEYLFVTLGLYNSCDVIRFVSGYWSSDGWLSDFDYVFYMQSYYTKLSIKGLGNIQSAVESGTYYSKSLYWYLKQRLDNMSDNIAEYEEKALSNQVVGNGYLQSINTNIISIKDSIDTGVNSIVSAISGISGGSSSYSLPSLSTELQRLFIPSLTWESIDFDEYMDSLGVLKIPFEMTNDVLDVTKASYSPTLDLHINDFEIDVTGNNDKLTVFEDQDYSFNPRSIFNNQAWTMLTYLNAFAVILAEAWFTYCHIFRREKADDR